MTISEDTLERAWEMRQKGLYSMGEIADKFGVNRRELIDQLTAMLEKQKSANDDD